MTRNDRSTVKPTTLADSSSSKAQQDTHRGQDNATETSAVDASIIRGNFAMTNTSDNANTPPASEKDTTIVIGRVSLQNTLLCKTLAQELGIICELASEELNLRAPTNVSLQLLDVELLSLERVIACLESASVDNPSISVALINLTEKQDKYLEEHYFGWPALQGVFVRDCDPGTLVNGVRSILAGQLWLPRRYLESFVKRHRMPSQRMDSRRTVELTRKEEQILRVMVRGSTNLEIAEYMRISPHTVKTHIYNLYKKLSITNRIEAVTWGRHYLGLPEE